MSLQDRIRRTLLALRTGRLSINEALARLRDLPYEELGFAKVDHHRAFRKGIPEVIFAKGKQPDQIVKIAKRILRGTQQLIITKLEPTVFRQIQSSLDGLHYHEPAQMAYAFPGRRKAHHWSRPEVLIVTAGTADIPVAEEARLTLECLGHLPRVIYDVGVAGIHRLTDHRQALERAKTIIVVAGMEGALVSVIGGLVDCPVIAVPTSVGYGAHFRGIAPLLTMLNTCAPGIAVMNIDNGFGAGVFAHLIIRRHP